MLGCGGEKTWTKTESEEAFVRNFQSFEIYIASLHHAQATSLLG